MENNLTELSTGIVAFPSQFSDVFVRELMNAIGACLSRRDNITNYYLHGKHPLLPLFVSTGLNCLLTNDCSMVEASYLVMNRRYV